MKKLKYFLVSAAILSISLQLLGCGKKAEKTESWAYSHEPGEEILSFYDDGEAFYKGEKYSYSKDDSYITLDDDNGDHLGLRYVMEGDTMLLYEKSTYEYDGQKNTDGIVGVWKQDNGWEYQFTDDGRFSEENIFFGRYTVDEENCCIRLMYDDPIEDAYLYYELDGKELTIDYPWPMVRTEVKS
ncbi:MAG: hypothetical protein J6O61_01235 [Butyrivibrio sp.]|uniref:hypothetical protein n=1 Tax=Butyrivibrio sp. TaxID=28121 RepID=UPI001B20B8A3|nr:hypothetical protein [Butyrivibrio sp.]MBO6239485.1 hypothetical protein [Butyrivibrio sp.]